MFSHSHTEIDNHPQRALHVLVNPSFESVLMSCHFQWSRIVAVVELMFLGVPLFYLLKHVGLRDICHFVAFSVIEMQGMVIMWRLLCWR